MNIPEIEDISWQAEILAGEEIFATASLDLLLHRSHVLDIRSRSYRLRYLERAPERNT
jgi:hypothetical protein